MANTASPPSSLVNLERVRLVSNKSFDDVLAGIYTGIGRPNIAELTAALAQAPTFEDFTRLVKDAVGGSDLLEFLRLDLHLALEKNPRMTAYKLVRIIAGNPLTMSQMTNYLPDAGSYAPVTILVYERDDGVHVAYDTVSSAISDYNSDDAAKTAANLDAEVIKLLTFAVS